MKHLTNIQDIELTLKEKRLCRCPPTMLSTSKAPPFYIKAPDCGVCNVMLDKVQRLADSHTSLCSFYTDIREEPLIAGRFLVYSGPTVLLLMDGKEIYRASQFINIEELEQMIDRYLNI